jgi:hypothetical protein
MSRPPYMTDKRFLDYCVFERARIAAECAKFRNAGPCAACTELLAMPAEKLAAMHFMRDDYERDVGGAEGLLW